MNKTTIENYNILRQEIVDKNIKLVGNILSEKEKNIDNKLTILRNNYIESVNSVPYNMPIIRKPEIWETDLYKFCLELPKGSDLHVHGTALLPMDKLIEFIKSNDKLFIGLDDYILTLTKDAKHIPLKEALEKNIIKYDDLFKKWTIIGVKHNENRWRYFENLFSYFEAIDLDFDVLYDYYVAAFEYYLNLKIYHIEIHLLLDSNYDKAYKTVDTIKNAYHKVKNGNPFFSVRIIGGGMKDYSFDENDFINRLENCYKIKTEIKDDYNKNEIKDFVVGFDLVNEEDSSKSLENFAPKLLKFGNEHPDFQYYLHSGESLTPESNNLIDAYLLNACRVGHGFNLYQYPYLLQDYVNKEICLEICPISNQSLGYSKNIRNHPFYEYIKRGVTCSICSDDPIFFEHNSLVDDFFALIVCFDLGLTDIKQLCINSISYSSLDSQEKINLMKHYKKEFDEFINKQ